MQSLVELKESETLEVLDEVTIPDAVIVKEENTVMSFNNTPAGTDHENDNDIDEFDTSSEE